MEPEKGVLRGTPHSGPWAEEGGEQGRGVWGVLKWSQMWPM